MLCHNIALLATALNQSDRRYCNEVLETCRGPCTFEYAICMVWRAFLVKLPPGKQRRNSGHQKHEKKQWQFLSRSIASSLHADMHVYACSDQPQRQEYQSSDGNSMRSLNQSSAKKTETQ